MVERYLLPSLGHMSKGWTLISKQYGKSWYAKLAMSSSVNNPSDGLTHFVGYVIRQGKRIRSNETNRNCIELKTLVLTYIQVRVRKSAHWTVVQWHNAVVSEVGWAGFESLHWQVLIKHFFFLWLVFEKSKVKKKEAENRPFLDKQVRAKEFIQTTYKLANPKSYKLADSKSNIKFKFKPNIPSRFRTCMLCKFPSTSGHTSWTLYFIFLYVVW